MQTFNKVMLLAVMASLFVVGCQKSEPRVEQPAAEHPTEHPTEHPKN